MTRRYEDDLRLFRGAWAKAGLALGLAVYLLLPYVLVDDFWLSVLNYAGVAAIGAIGLNLLTGYTGQVSLGHAFFIGVGAYTAAVISGDPDGRTYGFGITFVPFWVLGAGAAAAICGAVVAPLATRLRGLYLAIVTLGLVFIGEYFFAEWQDMSGGPSVGRDSAEPVMFGADLSIDGAYTEEQKFYWLALASHSGSGRSSSPPTCAAV